MIYTVFLGVLFPTAYCLVGSLLTNCAIMSVPTWIRSCLAHSVIVIAIEVVGLRSVCSCCSALVVGLVDFLLLFVLGVGTLQVGILSISSTQRQHVLYRDPCQHHIYPLSASSASLSTRVLVVVDFLLLIMTGDQSNMVMVRSS